MSYRVLSRKWRPKIFDEIIGQVHVSRTLKNAIKLNRVAHGFLFFGPRGVGKTTTARIFSKALNCAKLIKNNPCNKCNNCIDITSGRSLDVLEIDGASNRGIDEIRELREAVKYPPISGNYRIYIIDEVHMLTQQAFNALLKTLEEPPSHVKFIMATTEPHKIPQTILSRTLRFNFHRLSSVLIEKQIVTILEKEKILWDEGVLQLIAEKADGSMRDALSFLDQIIAYTDNRLSIESVREILGIIEEGLYLDLYKYCISGANINVLKISDNVLNLGYSIPDFVRGWNEYLRKCILLLAGQGDLTMLTEDSSEYILSKKNKLNHFDHLRMIEISLQFESRMNKIHQIRIAFESMLLKLCSMDSSVMISDLLNKIENINSLNNTGAEKCKNIINSEDNINKTDIIKNHNDVKTKILENKEEQLNLPLIKKIWPEVILKVEELNPKLHVFLEEAFPMKIENNLLLIKLPDGNEFQAKSLQKDVELLQSIFMQLRKYKIKIQFHSNKKVLSANKNKDIIKKTDNHPLLMDAMEMFDGKIIK